MNILFTIHDLQGLGGTETFTYAMVEQLKKKGHNICVYTSQMGAAAQRFSDLGIYVFDDLAVFDQPIDVIHAQHYAEAYCASVKFPQTPMIMMCHGTLPWQEQPLLVPNIYRYCAVSEEVEEHLVHTLHIPQDKVKVVRNGVNVERFRSSHSLNEVPQSVLLLSNRYNDQVLHNLEQVCKMLGADLVISGKRNNAWNVESLIEKADIVVSLGRGILEAASAGKGVVIYDYNGGDGFLTPENYERFRLRNFSGRTNRLMYTPEQLYQEIQQNYNIHQIHELSEIVRREHAIEVICSQLELLYTEALDWMPYAMNNEGPEYLYNRDVIFTLIRHWGRGAVQKERNIQYLQEVVQESKDHSETREKQLLEQAQLLEDLGRENRELRLAAEEESNRSRELVDELQRQLSQCKQIIQEQKELMEDQQTQLAQKENNTQYALGLSREKDQQLQLIYNSRGWRLLSKAKLFKLRFSKAINNPGWAVKRLLQGRRSPVIHVSQRMDQSKQEQQVYELDKPLVSVVIPIYDRTDVLIESIESILNQSYANIELLLVCDGSPQRTLDIVDSYKSNPRVRIFKYNNNSGNAVRGRNKAIKEARGLYLAFQDSDDIADPYRIEKSLLYMEDYKCDVVYGGWRALVDGTRNIDIANGEEIFSPDCDYKMLLEICVPCQSTVMVKLAALRDVGGLKTSMRYREDHELWLRLAYYGYKFRAIPEVLTNLRLHANNLELTYKAEDDHWFKLMLEEHKRKTALRPKIAYVIPGCGISGGIAVICQHVNRLLERGHDVLMITEDNLREIPWFPNQKVNVIPIAETPDNLDIIVATGWSTAYTVQQMSAPRKLYFVQSDESRFYEKGSREYYQAIETYKMDFEYMTEAKWIRQWLKDTFNQDAHYVPNGLDPAIVHPVSPMIPKSEKLRVLLEGPIDIPFKGMADAFEAVKDLDCEVWCISSAGRPREGWRCDQFFEKVPMINMKEIYSSCDILLKLSRVEGFFGPPLEMMACGGACVVGKVSGYDEYIIDGHNALAVDLGDVAGAREAVKRIIEDKELRNKLVANGKVTASEWRWEPTIDTLEQIFLS